MIYLQPQFRTQTGEILNVVSHSGKLLGYLLYTYKEKEDLYVLGHLDDIGEKQNYVDLIIKFVSGLKRACGVEKDPFVRVQCGGMQIDLNQPNGTNEDEAGKNKNNDPN